MQEAKPRERKWQYGPCPCSAIVFPKSEDPSSRNCCRFCSPSASQLRRRFHSYATWRSRSDRRKWDSNAETVRAKRFGFSPRDDGEVEEEEEEEEEEGEGVEQRSSGILVEVVDSLWILTAFKSFGWTLTHIIFSLLVATGPQAFFMLSSLALGLSALFLAFEKLSAKSLSKKKQKRKRKVRAKQKTSTSTVRNVEVGDEVHNDSLENQNGMKGYQSWVVSNDESTTRGVQDAPSFGGWDELDRIGSRKRSQERSSTRKAMIDNGKMSMKGKSDAPLLLRLLIAVFPFLSSWTKWFW